MMNNYNQFIEVMLQAPDQYLMTLENYRKAGILIDLYILNIYAIQRNQTLALKMKK